MHESCLQIMAEKWPQFAVLGAGSAGMGELTF